MQHINILESARSTLQCIALEISLTYSLADTHWRAHTQEVLLTGADLKANLEGLGAEQSGEITAALLE